MNKVSLCITTYNRNAYLFKSFEQILDDERIGEIIIVDDNSDPEIFNAVAKRCEGIAKVKLFRNSDNYGVFVNKQLSVRHASSDYCIVFDSDNVIGKEYLDKIYLVEWNPKTILAPDFAQPQFDYRHYSGVTFRKDNVAPYCGKHFFNAFLNTMNYFVHRDSYLSVWQPNPGINGADSIYMNYLWLWAGNEIHCLKGLHYFHRVNDYHPAESGSNFIRQARVSYPLEIEKLISHMR